MKTILKPLPKTPDFVRSDCKGPLKAKYRTPNRINFPTQHRSFSQNADLVTTGNVVSRVQRSSYIRAFTETECNGFRFPPGQLRDFDLAPFKRRMPAHVLRRVVTITQDRTVILYEFRTPYAGRKSTIHGYVISGTDRENYGWIESIVTGPTFKSHDVIDRVSRLVATKAPDVRSQAA
jgi:hypothetical protein